MSHRRPGSGGRRRRSSRRTRRIRIDGGPARPKAAPRRCCQEAPHRKAESSGSKQKQRRLPLGYRFRFGKNRAPAALLQSIGEILDAARCVPGVVGDRRTFPCEIAGRMIKRIREPANGLGGPGLALLEKAFRRAAKFLRNLHRGTASRFGRLIQQATWPIRLWSSQAAGDVAFTQDVFLSCVGGCRVSRKR